MASFQKLKTTASRLRLSIPVEEAVHELSCDVPLAFTLPDLVREISGNTQEVTRNHLLALLACLEHGDRVQPSLEDDDAARARLANLVARFIAPIVPPDEGDEDENGNLDQADQQVEQTEARSLTLGELGLDILSLLAKGAAMLKLSDQVIFTVMAFTDTADPWTTHEASVKAAGLLSHQFKDRHGLAGDEYIRDTILKTYLRPLFSRSQPATITASGRKAEYADEGADRPRGLPQDDRDSKPWKRADLRAMPVFAWTVRTSDEAFISNNWALFTPVLLALLDDPSTPIRARGLHLLAAFLAKFDGKILRNTGLASVFEDAGFPVMLALPSLTPVDESVELLPAAYEAVRTLGRKLASPPAADEAARRKLLDRVLREGVFTGYHHAKEYVRIAEILVSQAGQCVVEMGLPAVKHLKDLIPMFSSIMADPFATSSATLALATIRALQATMTTCWPRVAQEHWRNEIIKSLVLCWLHFNEEHQDAGEKKAVELQIRCELVKTAKMLTAIARSAGADLEEIVAPLVEKDPSLGAMFGEAVTAHA